jgi:hypothetical protein
MSESNEHLSVNFLESNEANSRGATGRRKARPVFAFRSSPDISATSPHFCPPGAFDKREWPLAPRSVPKAAERNDRDYSQRVTRFARARSVPVFIAAKGSQKVCR